MNQVCLVGRIASPLELRHTGTSGKPVCNFTIAVERKFKDTDGNSIVDFIDGVAWSKQAEFLCKWFDKGVRVGLTGELQTRRYEKDGKNIKVTEILVNTVEFADGKRDANANTNTRTSVEDADDDFVPLIDGDDDLPFN